MRFSIGLLILLMANITGCYQATKQSDEPTNVGSEMTNADQGDDQALLANDTSADRPSEVPPSVIDEVNALGDGQNASESGLAADSNSIDSDTGGARADAETVLKETLAKAALEDKNVLVHLGAPW